MKLLGDQSEWSKRVMAKFTHFDRLTLPCTVDLAHAISGAAGLARFFPPEENKPTLRETLRDALLPEQGERPGRHRAAPLENATAIVATGLRAQGRPVPAVLRQEGVGIPAGNNDEH